MLLPGIYVVRFGLAKALGFPFQGIYLQSRPNQRVKSEESRVKSLFDESVLRTGSFS